MRSAAAARRGALVPGDRRRGLPERLPARAGAPALRRHPLGRSHLQDGLRAPDRAPRGARARSRRSPRSRSRSRRRPRSACSRSTRSGASPRSRKSRRDPEPDPGRPDTALVNMGVYVFDTETLVRALAADARRDTRHDFGHDILPSLVDDGEALRLPVRRREQEAEGLLARHRHARFVLRGQHGSRSPSSRSSTSTTRTGRSAR